MNKAIVFAVIALALTGCGVDGAPSQPEVSGKTTFGVNSKTGAFSETEIGISIDLG